MASPHKVLHVRFAPTDMGTATSLPYFEHLLSAFFTLQTIDSRTVLAALFDVQSINGAMILGFPAARQHSDSGKGLAACLAQESRGIFDWRLHSTAADARP